MAANGDEEMQTCLSEHDSTFIYDFGCASMMTMANRETILGVWQHVTYFSILGELSQLCLGLRSTLGFDEFIDEHPTKVLQLLCATNNHLVTMDTLLDAISPTYSKEGSNRGATEEMLIPTSPKLTVEGVQVSANCPTPFL